MKKNLLLKGILFLSIYFFNTNLQAQNNTSSAMNGRVLDENGVGMSGASLLAIHTPTGTQYSTITLPDGKYNLPNIKTGGPYEIKASFVGYDTQTQKDIFLSLGQNLSLNFSLQVGAKVLENVTVLEPKDDILNSSRTGAATNIDNRTITAFPTLTRDINDYVRFSPHVNVTPSSALSFSGANFRYNNISIDGAVNNDVFGYAFTGTPGGQVGVQMISLDAIDEIQVVVAPYDVRQGSFTGGGVNATTKSGTNQFSGTAYGFYNNQFINGVNPTPTSTGERTLLDRYTDYQTGLSIGGPIIKNKLFFFLNTEIAKSQYPTLYNKGDAASLISVADIDAVQARANALGIPTLDSDGAFNEKQESQKFFIRFDWNINLNHKITLRHNYVRGYREDLFRSPTQFNFSSAAAKYPVVTNSTVVEWKANLGNKFSNNLILNYTNINADREPVSPTTEFNVSTNNNDGLIYFGGDSGISWDLLKQDILSLTDNFNIFLGRHSLTIGTHSEFFDFRRDFLAVPAGAYGSYSYSIDDFLNPANVNVNFYSLGIGQPDAGTLPSDKFQAAQLGFYIQDEFEIAKNFKLTAGIRMDIPLFFNTPVENQLYNGSKEAINSNTSNNYLPNNTPLWSPRIGFNWDVLGNKTLQIRGGAGIFTGRLPYAWISNLFLRQGNNQGIVSGSNIPLLLNPDTQAQYQNAVNSGLVVNTTRNEVNLVDRDLKFPQVFRVDLAVDYKLPVWGLVATVEGLFTQNINNIDYQNLNLSPSTRNLSLPNGAIAGDNRPVFPTIPPTNRTRLLPNTNYRNILYLKNTNEGYTYSLTAQITKPFSKGFSAMAAYTYGDAFSVNDGTNASAASTWPTPNVTGPNNPGLGRSIYSVGSRFISSLNYRKEYLKNFATSIGLFYTGQSGRPISYVYGGDINASGTGGFAANLIYIPRNQTEIALANNTVAGVTYTPAQQWAILDQFISNNPYLNSRRGQYAERNGDRTPFEHQIDMRLKQEFFIKTASGRKHTLQVTFDVFNVLNLLNKDWGFRYNSLDDGNAVFLMNFVGYQTQTGPNSIPGQTIITGINDRIPLYTVNVPINAEGDVNWARNIYTSRWQGQVGIRYIF